MSVFISSTISSAIFGAFTTYLEGRQATEALLAFMTGMFIFAGSTSRSFGQVVLDMGAPPSSMPLILATITCPISCWLVVCMDAAPKPSAADVAMRTARAPMTNAEKMAFLREWWLGIVPLVFAYASTTGVRAFRDLYAKQVGGGRRDVPP